MKNKAKYVEEEKYAGVPFPVLAVSVEDSFVCNSQMPTAVYF